MADKPTKRNTRTSGRDQFYESLPGVMQDYYYPQPDEVAAEDQQQYDLPAKAQREARLAAIITIILTAVIAVAMGLLFLKGLSVIESLNPNSSVPTTSQY